MFEPVEVVRDDIGMWTHPDYPNWEENVSSDEIKAWLSEHDLAASVVCFEWDAEEELFERYYEKDDITAVCDWLPTSPTEDHFLVSIHDTEDGPVAIFFARQETNDQEPICQENQNSKVA